VRSMSVYQHIADLIEHEQEKRLRLLDDELSKEEQIEVALATHMQFVQNALLEIARELDAHRAILERRSEGARGGA
jgi:hypothetical protein